MTLGERVRRWLGIAPPVISREQSIAIARQLCLSEGWMWREPVHVMSRRDTWVIVTIWGYRGMNARVVINKYTGRVVEAEFIPR